MPVRRGPSAQQLRLGGRLGVAAATLLVLLLPTLLAARQLAAPARPDELARLARAFAVADGGLETGFVRAFHQRAAGGAPLPDDAAARQQVVVRARTWQLAALFALTLALFAAVVAACGRLPALLATAAFAAAPAVVSDGAWLRPEGPATAAAAFATLLLVGVAAPARLAPQLARWPQAGLAWGLAVAAAAAIAVAVALLPSQAAALLVPGVVLALATAHAALRAVPIVRRGGWLRFPVRALNRRLLPWTAMSLAAPALALWLLAASLRGPADAVASTPAASGLVPTGVGGGVLAALAVLGAVVASLRVGAGLRRTGRIHGELVLYVAVATAFAAHLRAPAGRDLLPLAPFLAVLVAYGAQGVLLVAARAAYGARRVTAP